METVFLIGGSGFIGKNLVEYLYDKYDITVVDKYIDEYFFIKYPSVNIIKIDLVEDKIPETIATPDYIVNLASIVTAERDLSLFDGLISSNLKVLLNLFERFKDDRTLKLFIQFGSSEEYGNEGSPFSETMREVPNSPYALVKQLTVNTSLMLHANYGFPAMVVRPGNLFGMYQNKLKFIPYIISQLQEGKPINVTPCEQKRDFIYAADFAWCIGELIKEYEKCVGEIVNVASGKSVSLKSIIETCKTLIGKDAKINYGALPYRENDVMDLKCSIDKLTKIIGKPICFNIDQRLKEYAEQFK
jgi:nucleoside-diphosphate-sugar epimerase